MLNGGLRTHDRLTPATRRVHRSGNMEEEKNRQAKLKKSVVFSVWLCDIFREVGKRRRKKEVKTQRWTGRDKRVVTWH